MHIETTKIKPVFPTQRQQTYSLAPSQISTFTVYFKRIPQNEQNYIMYFEYKKYTFTSSESTEQQEVTELYQLCIVHH